MKITNYKAIIKTGEEFILNDYKLFDINNNEPEDYATAKWQDYSYVLEVFDDENGHPTINGICLNVSDIVYLNAL